MIIVRNGTHIMCGLAKQYYFKPIDDIGDTQIKTYSSEKRLLLVLKEVGIAK